MQYYFVFSRLDTTYNKYVLLFVSEGKILSDSLSPDKVEVHLTEGNNATLSCTYDGSPDSFLWYRQKPGASPEFLKRITESTSYVQEATAPFRQMSTTFDRKAKRVHLEISSTQGSDSALYYCALQPTVMGAQSTLHKNLTATGGGAMNMPGPFLCIQYSNIISIQDSLVMVNKLL